MAEQHKTPGVYIQEGTYPGSVVQVSTAIPVFIGYTEKAGWKNKSLANTPTPIASLKDYRRMFGGPAPTKIDLSTDTPLVPAIADKYQNLMFPALRMFFDNGGGPCWIVSIGTYGDDISEKDLSSPLVDQGVLEKAVEPTIVCIPEAILLSNSGWAAVSNRAINHCQKMRSRIALVDVYEGWKARDDDAKSDVIAGSDVGFRAKILSDGLSYAAAYYPWINTNLLSLRDFDLDCFDTAGHCKLAKLLADEGGATNNAGLTDLAGIIKPTEEEIAVDKSVADAEAQRMAKQRAVDNAKAKVEAATGATKKAAEEHAKAAALAALAADAAVKKARMAAADLAKNVPRAKALTKAHNAALQLSSDYAAVMKDTLQLLNRMPPSAAVAGVYALTDATHGVFKAPANMLLASVISPTVSISHDDQEDLNIPLDGKAVNAIRAFPGRGTLVWGARTLDGNSQDWRYINVRRTLIMLEQSIRYAIEAYAFALNDASTWVTVGNTISNFLDNQWKTGALAGATPEDAFCVDVGLGTTMTSNDVLEGTMKVVVKVAVTRPAEFIVLTFQQKMQSS